jgi:hypothetical protein
MKDFPMHKRVVASVLALVLGAAPVLAVAAVPGENTGPSSRGGFLGIGEEWVPIPPQAIAWSSQDGAFTLKSGAAQPERIAGLQHDDVPTQVQRTQLQALYERYGVTPYWQEG